jgi:hypothetical protein
MYGNKAPTLSGGLYRPVDVCKKSDLNHSCIFFFSFPFPPPQIAPVPNPYNRTTERSSNTFRLSTK